MAGYVVNARARFNNNKFNNNNKLNIYYLC